MSASKVADPYKVARQALADHLRDGHGLSSNKPSAGDLALHAAMHRRYIDHGHTHAMSDLSMKNFT